MKRLTYLLLVGIVLLSLGSGNAFAQATASGTIQGTVTDKTGAAVLGVEVVATNKGTAAVRTVTTNDSGAFRFDLMRAGTYDLRVSKAGFATLEQKIELLVGQTATADFSLSIGTASAGMTGRWDSRRRL